MVSARFPDTGEKFDGRLKFVDNAVDANSGSVKVKAVFDNHQGRLWPGAFVEVSQTVSVLKETVVVPQAAIIQSARGTIVYVMAEGKALLKAVKVLYAHGDDAAVSGIEPGDLVVLDGKQNLRPGSPVVERAKGDAGNAAGKARPATP